MPRALAQTVGCVMISNQSLRGCTACPSSVDFLRMASAETVPRVAGAPSFGTLMFRRRRITNPLSTLYGKRYGPMASYLYRASENGVNRFQRPHISEPLSRRNLSVCSASRPFGTWRRFKRPSGAVGRKPHSRRTATHRSGSSARSQSASETIRRIRCVSSATPN